MDKTLFMRKFKFKNMSKINCGYEYLWGYLKHDDPIAHNEPHDI